MVSCIDRLYYILNFSIENQRFIMQIIEFYVITNLVIDKYIMVYSLNHYGEFTSGVDTPVESGIYYRLSDDGLSWSEPAKKILTGWSIPFSYDSHSYLWHPNLIYSQQDQSKGHLVYSKAANLQEGHKMWAIEFQFIEN